MKTVKPATTLIFGGIITDRCFEVDRYPLSGQDAAISNAFEKIGGCALNVAVTLQNLGDTPYVVSMVGSDEPGRRIREYLAALNLPLDAVRSCPGGVTGYCLNIIDPAGERTFMTLRGCEQQFRPDMLSEGLLAAVSQIYVTGYYLADPEIAGQVLAAVSRLKRPGSTVFFDPGPLADRLSSEVIERMTGLSDWILPNRDEAARLMAHLGQDMAPDAWFRQTGCPNVVIKKGGQGADVFCDAGNFSVEGFSVVPKDTTGAGDSFAGGLIHAVAKGQSQASAVRFACACGALATTIEGPHGRFDARDIAALVSTSQIKAK